MSSTDEIGRRMKFLRRRQRVNLATLALKLDLPATLLRKWERGALPLPVGYQYSIAAALGVDHAVMLEDASKPVEVPAARAAAGARLKEVRVARDLSPEAAAAKLGVTPEILLLSESGEHVLNVPLPILTAFLGNGARDENALDLALSIMECDRFPAGGVPRHLHACGAPQVIYIDADEEADELCEDEFEAAWPCCPWCGRKVPYDTNEKPPCPHLAFIWEPESAEFMYATPSTTQAFDAWQAEMDEDSDEYDSPMDPEALASMGFDRRLVLITLSSSGMACGPVSSSIYCGFMLAAAGTAEAEA